MLNLFFILFVSFVSLAPAHFVLLGPPGSGKGSFCQFAKQKGKYHHLSIGDIIRTHIKKQTELGKQIEKIVAKGDYIDDTITLGLLENAIKNCLANNGTFILDGFPRNSTTLKLLEDFFEKENLKSTVTFIFLESPDAVCTERINSRLVCFNCFNVFNLNFLPIATGTSFTCTNCSTPLETRLGDHVHNTRKRLAYYRTQTEPLQHILKERYPVLTLKTDRPLEQCTIDYTVLLQKDISH